MASLEERIRETKLPEAAKLSLPSSLSLETMDTLADRPDMEEILKAAIKEVDHGSVERLETLVKRVLDRGL